MLNVTYWYPEPKTGTYEGALTESQVAQIPTQLVESEVVEKAK